MVFSHGAATAAQANAAICDLVTPNCGIAGDCCDGDYGVNLSNCGIADTEDDTVDRWWVSWELKYCGSTVSSGCEPLEDISPDFFNVPAGTVCSSPEQLVLEDDVTLSCTECGNKQVEWTVTVIKEESSGACNSTCDTSQTDCTEVQTENVSYFKGLCQCSGPICVGCCASSCP